VQGLKVESEVASVIHAVLSSNTWDGRRLELKDCVEMVSDEVLGMEINELVTRSSRTRLRGRSSRVALDKAMYSLSVVERAISECNLLDQLIGHPQNVTT